MKKLYFFLACTFCAASVSAQELYPYAEPASNMPAHSLSAKLTAMYMRNNENRYMQRYTPELMLGVSKKLMLHGAVTFADAHNSGVEWESARFYSKYRFLSNDGVHKHFRMAAYGEAAYSKVPMAYNELNLLGDHSGVQYGLIATQLYNKFAVSGTAGLVHLFEGQALKAPKEDYAFNAFQYSVSAGYLVLPVTYKNYDQTNVNVYVEAIGSRNLGFKKEKFFVDLAPSLQFIFRSTAKLNLGYRFELDSDMQRMARNSYMVSFEYIFLDVLRKKKR